MANALNQSQAARVEARAIFVFKLISPLTAAHSLSQSVARRIRAAVQLEYFLVINAKIRIIMSTTENNSEVAVDKVGEEKKDAKSELKGAKRAAEVSAHVETKCIH